MALFEKGNPGGPGRPKMPPELRKKWADLSDKTLAKLETLAAGGECPPNVLVKIAEIATDRAWGKPVQAVEADITERRPIVIDGAYSEKAGEDGKM
jgi:hypothetical protein